MERLLKLAQLIDTMNRRIGQLTFWLVLIMILVGAFNATVALRGRLRRRQSELQPYLELQWYLFSLLFLLAAAWALRDDAARARGRRLQPIVTPRRQAWIDLFGALVLSAAVRAFVLWVSYPSVRASWAIRERSPDPGRARALPDQGGGAARLRAAASCRVWRRRSRRSPGCAGCCARPITRPPAVTERAGDRRSAAAADVRGGAGADLLRLPGRLRARRHGAALRRHRRRLRGIRSAPAAGDARPHLRHRVELHPAGGALLHLHGQRAGEVGPRRGPARRRSASCSARCAAGWRWRWCSSARCWRRRPAWWAPRWWRWASSPCP